MKHKLNFDSKEEVMAYFKRMSPKKVKLCTGCPSKEIEMITGPKFTVNFPEKKETKSVTVVDMSKYKKNYKDTRMTSLF